MNSELRDLIVPYREHTLDEHSRIIQLCVNPKKFMWKGPRPAINDVEIWTEWLDACLTQASKRLTAWEENFLTSISDQLTHSGSLSPKQVEILERIYTEKV